MTPITCPHCQHTFAPAAGQKPPPWCRRCGGDLNGRPIGSSGPVEEPVALIAVAASPAKGGGRWGNRPTVAPTQASPSPSTTDTPPPAAGRWAKPPPSHAAPGGGWTAADARRVEEQAARETDTRPPAWWGYLFAGACLLIPVLTLGGAVPVVLGSAGASACVKVAHSHTLSTLTKLLACLAITGLVWGLFVALLVVAVKANAGLAPQR